MIRLGLALGSGGARGLAHIGALSVLEEAGIRPACVAGTSMGAIIGALYAESLSAEAVDRKVREYIDDPELKASWKPFQEEDPGEKDRNLILELGHAIQRRMLKFRTFTSPALQDAAVLRAPLRRFFDTDRIEDLRLPFACVAVDLITGEACIFRSGELADAVYASSAIPGVFPPLARDGALLVDGGGPYRVPVGVCRELGADFVLALDLPSRTHTRYEYRTGIEIVMRADQIARDRLNRLVLKDADLVVTPDVGGFHWANFWAVDDLVRAGQDAMRAALPELMRRMKAEKGLAAVMRRSLRRTFGSRRHPDAAG